MITKKIKLEQVEENIRHLQKDLNEVKITTIPN